MPPFTGYNPAHTKAANIFVFPADTYRLKVVNLKPFQKKDETGTVKNFGVRIHLECVEGPFTGKKAIFAAFLHSEGGQGIAKLVQMAAFGFDKDSEADFDAHVMDLDWSFDHESGNVGSGWQEMMGKELYGEFAVKMYEGREQQDFKGWRCA